MEAVIWPRHIEAQTCSSLTWSLVTVMPHEPSFLTSVHRMALALLECCDLGADMLSYQTFTSSH